MRGGGRCTLLTQFITKRIRRLLPGQFESLDQVGQVGGEELDELGGELGVYGRPLS